MADSPFKFTFLDHPNSEQLTQAVKEFESSIKGGGIHPTAQKGLLSGFEITNEEPFPKIESHESYLYGMLSTPTDVEDGLSEFFTVQFIIHEQMSLVVLWGPTERRPKRAKELFERISQSATDVLPASKETPREPGDIFVQIARVIIDDLRRLLVVLHESVDTELRRIEDQLFDEKYHSMSHEAADTYTKIRRLKFEILSIAPIISETQNVFRAISDRKVVIRPPFVVGSEEAPPFSINQRIWISDLLMHARSLKAQRNGLEQEVRLLSERLESLENRRQTAAQMRFAAVASILLFPALVVGFFGQNFVVNPWSESRWSWEISAFLLVCTAVIQFFYFKRKKWF